MDLVILRDLERILIRSDRGDHLLKFPLLQMSKMRLEGLNDLLEVTEEH